MPGFDNALKKANDLQRSLTVRLREAVARQSKEYVNPDTIADRKERFQAKQHNAELRNEVKRIRADLLKMKRRQMLFEDSNG